MPYKNSGNTKRGGRLFFSDFDNTLYMHNDPVATKRNLSAVRNFRKAGNRFGVATSRSFANLKTLFPDMGDEIDYLILDNGAVCAEPSGVEIFNYTLAVDAARMVVDYIGREFSVDKVYYVYHYDMLEHSDFDRPVTKIYCWVEEAVAAEKIKEKVLARFGDIVKVFVGVVSQPCTLGWVDSGCRGLAEIVPIEAGKERAIARLMRSMNAEGRIITVGDSSNDREMLRAFDGYAVENATPDILTAVKKEHIVASVADLLEGLMKN